MLMDWILRGVRHLRASEAVTSNMSIVASLLPNDGGPAVAIESPPDPEPAAPLQTRKRGRSEICTTPKRKVRRQE